MKNLTVLIVIVSLMCCTCVPGFTEEAQTPDRVAIEQIKAKQEASKVFAVTVVFAVAILAVSAVMRAKLAADAETEKANAIRSLR